MTSKRVLCAVSAFGLVLCGCGTESDTVLGNAGSAGADEPANSGGRGAVGNAVGGAESTGGSPADAGAGGAGVAGTGAGSGGSAADTGGSGGAGAQPGAQGGAGGTSASTDQARGVVPSAGCARAAAIQSGVQELELGGALRTFIVDIPVDYAPDRPYPLVFGFHGRDFTGAEFRDATYGNVLSAAGAEAIVVHPDATEEQWAWELEGPEDVLFFDAMLDALTQGLCVDEARVFATGHSSGGYFVNVLGCQRGDVLRAIAPVAGGAPTDPDGGVPVCQRPVSAWIAHAEDDEIVPFLNGEASLAYWLDRAGCDAEAVEPTAPATCVAYAGCDSGLAVHFCPYQGGHDWPSFGATGAWAFFESF